MSNRTELNNIQLGRFNELTDNISMGELLTLLISNLTATQTGVTPTNMVITLANTPTEVFQVNMTAGTNPGIPVLRKGVVATNTLPASGEAVWQPGTKTIKFSSVDSPTAVSVTYVTATNKAAALERTMETTNFGTP